MIWPIYKWEKPTEKWDFTYFQSHDLNGLMRTMPMVWCVFLVLHLSPDQLTPLLVVFFRGSQSLAGGCHCDLFATAMQSQHKGSMREAGKNWVIFRFLLWWQFTFWWRVKWIVAHWSWGSFAESALNPWTQLVQERLPRLNPTDGHQWTHGDHTFEQPSQQPHWFKKIESILNPWKLRGETWRLPHVRLMCIYHRSTHTLKTDAYIYTAYNRCKEDTYIDHIQKICGTAWLSWWALPMIPRSQWFLQSLLTRNTWFLEDGWWYDDTKFVWSSIRMSHCVNWDRPRISIVL